MADSVNVEKALRELLTLGVEASQRASQRTRLDELKDRKPEEWSDLEWDFANERGLIPSSHQSEYEMRLLERRQAKERAQLAGWQGGNLPHTGTATLGVSSGQMPSVPERPVAATLVQEVDGPEGAPSEEAAPYEEWSNAELRSEIGARNASRVPEDQVKSASGKKEDMAAALYADDEAAEARLTPDADTEE